MRSLLLFFIALAAVSNARSYAANTITNARTVLRMDLDAAQTAQPVRLTGTLTFYVSASQLCFVQDDTAGVYVYPARWPGDLQPGDVVEVEGETAAGRFSPIVHQGILRRTGRTGTVTARKVSIGELNTGQYDCQWISLEGVVQGTSSNFDSVKFDVWTGGSAATVLLFGTSSFGTNLLDARVRFEGVAGTFYAEGRLTGFGLFVRPENVAILQPPPDPFARPARRAKQPLFFSPEGAADNRIKIRGTVVVHWPGTLFLQDSTSSVRVNAPNTPLRKPGEAVEAAGFLRDATDAPWIANALLRGIGNDEISYSGLPLEQLIGTGATVPTRLEGTLLRALNRTNSTCLLLESGERTFSAFLRENQTTLQPGSKIRVSGVWSAPPDEWKGETGPGVWLHSNASLTVLALPPDDRAPTAGVHPAVVAALAGATILLAALALRKRQKAREFEEKTTSTRELLAETQAELQRLVSSRERLGRDLHDHIIQSIYAVGLNLDDCAQQLRSSPDRVEPRLRTALAEINGVIRELRNLILGLESHAIEPREFRTALKSLALALGKEKSSRMRFDIEQSAIEALTPLQATELIHIAREALSNSLRHAQADTTTFGLHTVDSSVRFSIEDDGSGFDPRSANNSGFGLRNMAKRAENLGAIFTIQANPGTGTRILLDIPHQKQHLSRSEPSSRSNR